MFFFPTVRKNLKKVFYNESQFLERNKSWLESYFIASLPNKIKEKKNL